MKQTKQISGTVTLPPSTNMFILSSACALAFGKETRIEPVFSTPLSQEWIKAISNAAEVETKENMLVVTPHSDFQPGFISIPEGTPFRDFMVFLFTSMGFSVELRETPNTERVDKWRDVASGFGCRMEAMEKEGKKIFQMSEDPGFRVPQKPVSDDILTPLLGTALGLKRDIKFEISYHFSSPLKNLFGALGYEFKITNNRKAPGIKSTLAKKIKLFNPAGSSKDKGLSYTIEAKFSCTQKETALITLPGDEDLEALLLFSKTLITKGQFLIVNAPSDTTLTPFLSYLRIMGNKPSFQASDETTFGETGTMMIQKPVLKARKLRCSPIYMYRQQLPAMVILSAFSEGKSIFRNLEEIQIDEPGIIQQMLRCIETIGGRYGRMEDGIIIENTTVRDGFDIQEPLPAVLAGACTVAGLKCSGESNINSEMLLRRWPDFKEILDTSGASGSGGKNDSAAG